MDRWRRCSAFKGFCQREQGGSIDYDPLPEVYYQRQATVVMSWKVLEVAYKTGLGTYRKVLSGS